MRELYQEMILDHNKRPRNQGVVDEANAHADGHNPLCGDTIHLTLMVEGGRVKDVKFEGHGCAISTASASLMTEAVMGKTVEQAHDLFQRFHRMVTEDGYVDDSEEFERLVVLAGVKEFPNRVKCATLAWHTLESALSGQAEVSTE